MHLSQFVNKSSCQSKPSATSTQSQYWPKSHISESWALMPNRTMAEKEAESDFHRTDKMKFSRIRVKSPATRSDLAWQGTLFTMRTIFYSIERLASMIENPSFIAALMPKEEWDLVYTRGLYKLVFAVLRRQVFEKTVPSDRPSVASLKNMAQPKVQATSHTRWVLKLQNR